MQRLWLIFAQTATIAMAVLFVVSTLKPEWISRPAVLETAQSPQASGSPHPPPEAQAFANGSYAMAAQAALPAVVHVFTSAEVAVPRNPLLNDPFFRRFFGAPEQNTPQRRSGLGSGVLVSTDGYILTNNHVIESADAIEVALNDGKKYSARIVGRDPESDLAVLRIDSKDPLVAINFAPDARLNVGDVVLAIGNPFGVGQTVTMGIVSALGRSHLGINTFENFIQTDAAINPGNSGGALVDVQGRLIGINTAIYSQSGGSLGIGFAIPVSLARNIMEQIIQNGDVVRGWIGVEAQEITTELASSIGLPDNQGILLAGVVRGGPADMAGVRPGEVLLAINGEKISDPKDMLDKVAALKPGESAQFRLRRQAMVREVSVQVGKRPKMQRPGR